LTDQRWRFMILPRYALQTVFESKMMTSFFTFCFLPHLFGIVLIYLRYNIGALAALNIEPLQFLNIDASFFLNIFAVETYLTFLLITFIGPNLVAPDLANNALPLYLSRPFTKSEYIAGKLSVLVIVSSLITWIPGMLLIAIQVNEAGMAWLWDNIRIPLGILVGSWIWILTVSLIALALSAWIKMRPGTIFALFGLFFVLGTFGFMANQMLDLRPAWGVLLNMNTTMRTLWEWLLLGQTSYGPVFLRGSLIDSGVPSWAALASLAGFSALSLFLLLKKIRACEVVR
jgi:ABC-2 type transport system permease protein